MKNKIDSTKALSIIVTVLGVMGTLLSNKVDMDNRNAMKDELRKEILDELSKSK